MKTIRNQLYGVDFEKGTDLETTQYIENLIKSGFGLDIENEFRFYRRL